MIIKQDYGTLTGGELEVESIITDVQKSLTAGKNYATGKTFIYDGKMYKATSDIAAGSAIVLSGSGANATPAGTVMEKTVADQTFGPNSTNAQSGKAIADYSNGKFIKTMIYKNQTKTITLPVNSGVYLFFGATDTLGAVYHTQGTSVTKMGGNDLPSSIQLHRPNNTTITISSTVNWGVGVGIMYLGEGTPTISTTQS